MADITTARDDTLSTPPHTQTESTLAPTAEFTRIFLLAWVIRYIFRGFSGATFEERVLNGGLRGKILNTLSAPGRMVQKWLGGAHKPGNSLTELEAGAYSLMMGFGSGFLSWRYGEMVKSDITNIFRETVAYEKNIPVGQVTFHDITQSDNAIIQRTIENYRGKMFERLGTDGLFFLAAPLRKMPMVDVLLGLKGVQIFADTWKRKTTMFEDLVTFVNNKINPRNGLGQQITTGEVFDLYQHYAEAFAPGKMFNNVLIHDAGEADNWAKSQRVFKRVTELMNLSYAYKHDAALDRTGKPGPAADFTLPKFVFMLGQGMIDPHQPERTLMLVEIANTHGIEALKQSQAMVQAGTDPSLIAQRFPVAPVVPGVDPAETKNAVIPKGSTMQLAAAPGNKIQLDSVQERVRPAGMSLAVQ